MLWFRSNFIPKPQSLWIQRRKFSVPWYCRCYYIFQRRKFSVSCYEDPYAVRSDGCLHESDPDFLQSPTRIRFMSGLVSLFISRPPPPHKYFARKSHDALVQLAPTKTGQRRLTRTPLLTCTAFACLPWPNFQPHMNHTHSPHMCPHMAMEVAHACMHGCMNIEEKSYPGQPYIVNWWPYRTSYIQMRSLLASSERK